MRFLLATLAVTATLTHAAYAPPAPAVKEERLTHGETLFRVVRVSPARLELRWRDPNGAPYGTFERLTERLARQGRRVVLAMNAGIYMENGTPLGLHVEEGRVLRPLNTRDGYGNFYLRPNGVLYVKNGRARVVTTEAYARSNPRPDLAVQSGPMLLIGGRVNPNFNPGSTSALPRNGVCVLPDGRVALIITATGHVVTFHAFASFLKSLGCRDALFMDGNVSSLRTNGQPSLALAPTYGAFFTVTEPQGR